MKKFNSFETQLGESVVLTDKAKLSLYKKSSNSGISTDILEEVYRRGYSIWNESFGGSPDSFAFDRVNSFIADGFAAQLDEDLNEKRGLWDNIHAKRARIKAGSGEHMRKPGSKGAPTDAAIKASQNEDADPCWEKYKQVGMKMKNGKKVPNCVPVKEQLDRPLPSIPEIADKFNMTVDAVKKAIKHGATVEKEHTKEQKAAERIATAHINERPDYYKKLQKAGLEEDAEAHSKDFRKPSSRFIGSDELTDIYKKQTPGQIIKKVVRERLEEGDVIMTKFATKNLQKRGIEGPHKIGADDLGRAWGYNKMPKSSESDRYVAYHGDTARIMSDPSKGKHVDIKHGGIPSLIIDPDGSKTGKGRGIYSYGDPIKTSVIRKQAPKKTGNVVKIKEAAVQPVSVPAPTAAANAPTRLGRTAPTYQSSTIGNQGLPKTGPTSYSASSPTTPRGLRSMTSGSTQASAKTLSPQRVSASQPTPKTASAPAPAPKPSASFGSSSRPTTASATTSGMQKSPGYNLSSGMSDAGKAKVKPTAPIEIPASAGKAASVLGKFAKVAGGPAATAAMTVMSPQPAGEKKSEFERQADAAKGISYKPQGRSVSDYEKDVLTPKNPEAPRPKVDAPLPPTRPEYMSRGQAFSAARSEKGGAGGEFSYGDKKFQTNVKGEPYVKTPTPTSVTDTESGKIKKIKEAISEATYKGKIVPLNKPMKGDVKKSKVYVDPDGDGKAQKVNFGDKTLSIKKNIPARKKSYCARSGGQGNLTDKTSANYWSRRAWNCEETEVNELSVPAGTTGKRKTVSTSSVAIRMASGKIEKHPPGKSGSSGGGDEE